MKRRQFLIASAAAGATWPMYGFTQARPCPPSPVSSAGGTSSTTACAAGNAIADWQSRIGGAGVVWHHNFDSRAEVDNFRFQGGIGTVPDIGRSDGNCRFVANDGFAGGGCLELNVPANGICNSGWWRPFSPVSGSGNGRGSDDPGANGTISIKPYNPSDSGQYNWQQGYYGHSSYRAAGFDGSEFYLQMRVKLSANRANSANPPGKLIYLDVPNGSDQEIVVKSWSNLRFDMYTNFGSRSNSYMYEPQDAGSGPYSTLQPGSQYATPPAYWKWPTEEWVTVLFYMSPGRHNAPESRIAVWAARAGETTYTKIWDKPNYVLLYDPAPFAYNVIKASAYMNGVAAGGGQYSHRFTQFIFSRQFIPCPLA